MHIGILGGGNISGTHARAAAAIPGVKVVAFHGTNRERTAKLAEPYGAAVYDTLDDFLSHRPMDLVAIGSPSGLHAQQGIAAARRGFHVLVEKPLDITTGRADDLIGACEEAKVKLGVFFQDRLRPAIVEIKQMIDSGELGTPVMIAGRVRWYRPPRVLLELEMARDLGARRRRRADEPGDSHRRSRAVDVRPDRAGVGGGRDAGAQHRGGGYGRGGHRIHERRARHHRSGDVALSRVSATARSDRIERHGRARGRQTDSGRPALVPRVRVGGRRAGCGRLTRERLLAGGLGRERASTRHRRLHPGHSQQQRAGDRWPSRPAQCRAGRGDLRRGANEATNRTRRAGEPDIPSTR